MLRIYAGLSEKSCFINPGTVSKLRNNLSEFGFTDAVCTQADVLLTSAYDLDNGLAFLNGKFAYLYMRNQGTDHSSFTRFSCLPFKSSFFYLHILLILVICT